MSVMNVTRVPNPVWAGPTMTETVLESGGERAQAILAPRFIEVLGLIQDAVEEYVNDAQLAVETSEQGFPARAEMSGNYYVADVSYDVWSDEEESVERVTMMTHFMNVDDAEDYLGLEVRVCLGASGALELFAIESSSI